MVSNHRFFLCTDALYHSRWYSRDFQKFVFCICGTLQNCTVHKFGRKFTIGPSGTLVAKPSLLAIYVLFVQHSFSNEMLVNREENSQYTLRVFVHFLFNRVLECLSCAEFWYAHSWNFDWFTSSWVTGCASVTHLCFKDTKSCN